MSGEGTVGILAGGGPLPVQLARQVVRKGRDVFIVGFEGFADPNQLAAFPHKMIRLAAAGEILGALRRHKCRELVMIGPVRRPAWRDLRPDAVGARILMQLGRAVFAGDDGLLAAVVRVLEGEGFCVRGAHEFLHDDDQRVGALGAIVPNEQAWSDIAKAAHVLSVMASLDIGQGCVVQHGLVLAIEAVEGTDAMLQRCQHLKQSSDRGGVLLKMPKLGQEIRADMPALGPTTVRLASRAALQGIAFVRGMTLIIQEEICIAEANRLGLFLQAIPSGELDRLSKRMNKAL